MIHIKLDKNKEIADAKMIHRRPLREAALSIFFRTLASFFRLVSIIFIPRYLPREFYGLYSFYMSRFITFLAALQSPIKFWTFREEAYGLKISKASIKISLIISSISYLISLLVLLFIYDVPLILSVLAASLGSLYIIYDILTTISNAYRPHITQLAFLILRTLQAVLIIVLVILKTLTIMNLFFIIIICYVVSILFLLLQFKDIIRISRARVSECLKRWLKKSYIPIFGTLATFIYSIDAFYMTKLLGFNYVAGFFLALAVVYNIYNICGSAAQGLSSYLLMTKDIGRSKAYTYLTLLIAVPAYIFIILYPWYIVSIYGYKYVNYMNVLRIVSTYGLIFLILNLLTLIGMGIDSTDIEVSSFNDIKRSTSFKVQLIKLIVASIYIIVLIPLTYYLYICRISPLLIIETWALTLTIRALVELIVQYLYSIRKVVGTVEIWSVLVKPLLILLTSSIVSALLLNWYEASINILLLAKAHLSQIIFTIFVRFVIFLLTSVAICLAIDKDLRNIIKVIISRLTRRIG